MKYFRVEEEYMEGFTNRQEVSSDGEPTNTPYDVEETIRIYLGYNVFMEDEQGYTQDVEFYPIVTNMKTLEDNREQVLEQIKCDYPASEWCNNNW